jgi:V/A-type H+-transporting ATPase subunit E
MALDAVIDEIRAKGRNEAGLIQEETRQEVERILQEAQQKVVSIKLAAEEEVERATVRIKHQETSAANLVVKREMLNAQKDVLDQVYQATVDAIANLPGEFHSKAVRELLKKAVKEIKEGVVYCNERDIPAVEAALSSLKTLSGFTMGGKVDIDGGIVAESVDGSMQLDYSYTTFLSEVWESGLKEASDLLFG